MQTFSTINIRDPFILPHNGKYYLYGTRAAISWNKFAAPGNGFDVYVSEDLNTWSDAHEVFTPSSNFWGKYNFWAPEVHFSMANSICLLPLRQMISAAEQPS